MQISSLMLAAPVPRKQGDEMDYIASIIASIRDSLIEPAVVIQRSWRGFSVRRSAFDAIARGKAEFSPLEQPSNPNSKWAQQRGALTCARIAHSFRHPACLPENVRKPCDSAFSETFRFHAQDEVADASMGRKSGRRSHINVRMKENVQSYKMKVICHVGNVAYKTL